MQNKLAEFVADLHLQPGQTYRTKVNDIEVQLYRPAAGPEPKPPQPEPPAEEEPSQFADMIMLEPWFESPPPERTITVKATFGPLPFPDPPVIPTDDEATE